MEINKKWLLSVLIIACSLLVSCRKNMNESLNKQSSLLKKEYYELPLGSIKAKGWLLETLKRQKNGMTSQMDVLYPEVMGARNGWLGGDGDQWERGPYWIDGLLPLAYILDDDELKEKAKPWIEWALGSQKEDGFFGPDKDYTPEKGLQRNNSKDWWPRMVVLKVLKQYYSATGDERVITFLTKYFQYQLKTLPDTPLDTWTFWAKYRACDNLDVVYWLYNITGDKFLLDLGNLLHQQSYDYIDMFLNRDDLTRINTIHCVNLAQGIKEPVIYYQHSGDEKCIAAVKKAFQDIRKYHGLPQGMYGGDEALHGNNPTQGSELCAVVELMFSLEEMSQITGDIDFLDHLERIAFNALPTHIADDFMSRQYFQQANQVLISKHVHNFDINHGETDLVYGLLTGYPCCTSNLHQGWPKFTQNLWYKTGDNGIAALIYSPSEVETKLGDVRIKIKEDTYYPMDNKIAFTISVLDNNGKVSFPFHLRIPNWCTNGIVKINGEIQTTEYKGGAIAIIAREWSDKDVVELELPMLLQSQTWYENAISIERGPLVYALRIEEDRKKIKIEDEHSIYGKFYYEVYPKSKWNFGIVDFDEKNMDKHFDIQIDEDKMKGDYPWTLENSPITITAKAMEIPSWQLYNESAGAMPYSKMIYGYSTTKKIPIQEIKLIPYGCTTLRISEFPVINQ
jgi:DUF1680 family protein